MIVPISCLLVVVASSRRRFTTRASSRAITISDLFSRPSFHIVGVAMHRSRLIRQSFVDHPLSSGATKSESNDDKNDNEYNDAAQGKDRPFERLVVQESTRVARGGS